MDECKGCGKRIVWGKTSDEKRIPLDPVPPVYWFHQVSGSAVRHENCYVSHFATCRRANDFSSSKKKAD